MRSDTFKGWTIRARQRGDEMLKRIATSLAGGCFDPLALMKVLQEVRGSQDEKLPEDDSLDMENLVPMGEPLT